MGNKGKGWDLGISTYGLLDQHQADDRKLDNLLSLAQRAAWKLESTPSIKGTQESAPGHAWNQSPKH